MKLFISHKQIMRNILKEIINLDNKKNGTFKNIPTRRTKDAVDVCSPVLANIWNEEIVLYKIFPEKIGCYTSF